jgi:ubiquinone/menaquinone biosynthesis C-methylase UbiE
VSERLRSVVDQLGLRPDDRVLEIGCGHGVAASLVCERLGAGHLTAVDRSPTMIEAAIRRNAAYLLSGKAEFLIGSLEALDLEDRRFDKIFAVRVGLFHREPERARKIVERWLAPGGAVFAFFDEPGGAPLNRTQNGLTFLSSDRARSLARSRAASPGRGTRPRRPAPAPPARASSRGVGCSAPGG